jgi:probable phosphoglycerate mutase
MGMSLFPEDSASSEFIYAHCDGGSRGNPGPSGFGAVITDARGNTLAELSEFLGIRTNNFAEYSGLLAVLAWALEHGYKRVKLVSDSELMVKQIQGKYKVNSPDLKPLWQQARERIAKLASFEITHALRHKNKAADALANQAMDRGMRRTVLAAPPVPVAVPARVPVRVPSPAPAQIPAQAPPPAPPRAAAIEPAEPPAHPALPQMLRGFTKDGAIRLLGGHTLPDGIFVKIIRE